MKAENLPTEEKKNHRPVIWGLLGLLCGVFLGILTSVNRGDGAATENSTSQLDNNRDGVPDATLYYEHGVLRRTESDRNFDGRPDHWEWYEDGIALRAESDDNFDGRVDGWAIYRNGNVWLSEHDTDKNGVPDVFYHYEHGVISLAVWRPNQTGRPTRIEFYAKAVKARELRDTTGDGLMDTVIMFDAFENQVSEEKLIQPLPPEDAVRGIRRQL